MSRISQDLAKQIAFKLTEKSRLAADKLHVEYRELATIFYEESIPPEVKTCFKKFPDWFDTGGGVRLNGHGFSHEYLSPTRPLLDNGNRNYLRLNSKMADQLIRAKMKWEKAVKKYNDLKQESESALLALKTYNNIRKELPEAAAFLPPPMSNALVVNFSGLKRKLSQQPEVTERAVKEVEQ